MWCNAWQDPELCFQTLQVTAITDKQKPWSIKAEASVYSLLFLISLSSFLVFGMLQPSHEWNFDNVTTQSSFLYRRIAPYRKQISWLLPAMSKTFKDIFLMISMRGTTLHLKDFAKAFSSCRRNSTGVASLKTWKHFNKQGFYAMVKVWLMSEKNPKINLKSFSYCRSHDIRNSCNVVVELNLELLIILTVAEWQSRNPADPLYNKKEKKDNYTYPPPFLPPDIHPMESGIARWVSVACRE